jgi:hypothetical protein
MPLRNLRRDVIAESSYAKIIGVPNARAPGRRRSRSLNVVLGIDGAKIRCDRRGAAIEPKIYRRFASMLVDASLF